MSVVCGLTFSGFKRFKMTDTKNVIVVNLCSESEMENIKLAAEKTDLKLDTYFKSLLELTTDASKNSTSYATVSPILKAKMASFKTIFGKHRTDAFCNDATVVCFKLLNTFQQYDPESVYDLYIYWKMCLSSFTTESRANTFIDCFRQFEQITEHLCCAENRWIQLLILSIVRLYTKKVVAQTMRALYSASGCSFLLVIQKIMNSPLDQETLLKYNNALLTSINSENESIHSFQPYKIMCSDKEYTLTDFELWLDWRKGTKVISFMAMSVTADKSNDICGFTSSKRMRVLSRQNGLFVRAYWALGTAQGAPRTRKIDIQFCISARTHSLILESDLRRCFKIDVDEGTASADKGLAVAKFVKSNKKVPDGEDHQTMTISIIDPDLNVREKVTESIQPADNRIQGTVEAATIECAGSQKEQHISTTSESQSIDIATAKTSDYLAQSSDCQVMSTIKNRPKKTFPKRRNDQIDDGDISVDILGVKPYRKRIRTDPLKHRLFATTVSSTTTKPVTVEVQYPRPPVQKATKRSEKSNELNVEEPNGIKPEESKEIEASKNVCCGTQMLRDPAQRTSLQKFNTRLWLKSWSIRNFFKEISTEPHPIVEDDIENEVDQISADFHYDSVSNPNRNILN